MKPKILYRIDQIDPNGIDQNLKEHKPFNENMGGPVVQFGMNAVFARRRPRVQIPPGPHLTFNQLEHDKDGYEFVICIFSS